MGFKNSKKGKEACKQTTVEKLGRFLKRAAMRVMSKTGGGGVGLGPTRIHFDSRTTNGSRVAQWGYSKKKTRRKRRRRKSRRRR